MVDGERVVFKGESEQGLDFYPGDVILTLQQTPHPKFKREGDNLRMNMRIELKDAILGTHYSNIGFDKLIQHLDGHDVMVSAEGIIQDGS